MDIVRLAIVYETDQAAAKLNRLNRQLGSVNGNTRRTALAAVGLAQAMVTGGVSATGLTSKLATLSSRFGVIGIGIALTVGLLAVMKRSTDKTREAVQKFADQLRDTRRRVDDLLRVDTRSPLAGEIERITDAIAELDRTLSRQRMNVLQRLFGGMSVKEGLGNVKRFIFGGEDPSTSGQRGALRGQLGRLTPEAQREATRGRFGQQLGLGLSMNRLLDLGKVDRLDKMLANTRESLEQLVTEGLDPLSEEALTAAHGIKQLEDQLRGAERAQQRLSGALNTMADSLEDFVVTGTLAFTDFLNSILRLLYRDFSGELIRGILRSAGSIGGGGGGSAGVVSVGKDIGGLTKRGPSLATNVTFQVNAMDAQGVNQFFQQHGAEIAGVVAKQADRSRQLRRKWARG